MSARGDEQRRAINQAVQALTKWLRERDAQPPTEREDAEIFARTFITDMNGHGWRFTPAGRVDPFARQRPADPAAVTRRGAELARALLPKLQDLESEGGQE
ncbi:hypothetical protein AB0J43_02745 [Nonomuraea fuscirosea]